MGCGCGSAKKRTRRFVLSYEDGSGRRSSEHDTRIDAEIKDAQNGGGGVVRSVDK